MTEKENRKSRIINIVYGTIEKYQSSEMFKKVPLEKYDNWKDDIIEKFQDYIVNNYKRKR